MLTVNLASVLLARAAQREHEFAVSRALGADDVAVARGTVLEGVLLGLAGGALGALGAVWGTQALVALAPLDLPRRDAIGLDWQSAAAVIGVGVTLGLLAALAPALFATRSSLASLLANSGLRGGGGQQRLRRGMIVAQAALSLVLLNSGALVVRSFDRLLRTDPGFRSEGVFTVLIRTPPAFFPNSEVVAFQDRVTNALASVPGVTRVGAAAALPLGATSYAFPNLIAIPDAPGNTGDRERDAVLTDVIRARAGYFEVMGVRLVAGRTFVESPGEAREAVIDTTFANRFFPGANPLGAKIPGDDRTIVGVVDHARLYGSPPGRPPAAVSPEYASVVPACPVLRARHDAGPGDTTAGSASGRAQRRFARRGRRGAHDGADRRRRTAPAAHGHDVDQRVRARRAAARRNGNLRRHRSLRDATPP
jgi:putative ABC transport system permease protein